MASRLELQTLLETILGSEEVYYQPPPTVKISYPAIVYELSTISTVFADNNPYRHDIQYKVTIIDRDPDSSLPGKIAALPKCSFDRPFIADNLNHFVFNLFF